jgi:hypothetical protein
MPHVFEIAPTGRAKCRGCGSAIAKGELRFGEKLPNPFGDGEMTLWFHPECGALKRPESYLEAVAETAPEVPYAARLEAAAREGAAHRRLPRIDGAQRSPSGRAKCRHCREVIPKDAWRIQLVFFQDGRFEPAGAIHAGCCGAYFETADVLGRVCRFASLTEEEAAELRAAIA